MNKEPGRGKFDRRGCEGIFLGYPDNSKAFRIWCPEKRKVLITRDVKFLEDDVGNGEVFPTHRDIENSSLDRRFVDVDMSSSRSKDSPKPTERRADDEDCVVDNVAAPPGNESEEEEEFYGFDDVEEGPSNTHENVVRDGNGSPIYDRAAPGRPKIERTGRRGRPRKLFKVRSRDVIPKSAERHEEARNVEHAFLPGIPLCEAMASADANDWRQAIVIELTSILKNDTFDLVDRPNQGKVIGSRVVLRNKFKPDGSLERRKAILVAQGFSQIPGIHFTETFAPVTRFGSIRLMASIVARNGMKIQQFDITTAYLNGEIEEEILMEPPKDFERLLKQIIRRENDTSIRTRAERMLREIQSGDKVCRLKKS